jgi:hypothetical protein
MNIRQVFQVANRPNAPENNSVHSPIRRRLIKLQDIADEAALRAETLQWMMDSFPKGDHGPDQVRVLRETAATLRWAASHLIASSSPEEERSAEAS